MNNQPDIPEDENPPTAASIPAKNSHATEPAPNRTKADAAHNGGGGDAAPHPSGGSSGYNSIAIKVPPLNLDGLSASGATESLRNQMAQDRDEEIEELNQRIRDLERENQQVRK